ncbi:MAG: tRNA (N(6)-L-threonylcarbamoyladenosine(37)-C(2))-methylthiotransferase MtaB [Chthonomonas sp.]|nr:tRNA (N(6)-L-threonylcarbamoyladenosine(37)-C(2))-methylthiotransferase MtaB [Chthonomonas sp.]
MPSAAFTTLGCKVNQYETQRILQDFEAAGWQIVPFEGPADVYVINTCSVTSDAERKSRYTIRRAARFNEEAKIVVTGCAAQMSLNKREEVEGAHLVVPNPEKLETFARFSQAFPETRVVVRRDLPQTSVTSRTRATVKVQDGCSIHCSYCSIPHTRPGMVSRPATEVLAEIESLRDQGYLEVVLTGVLIGAYGPETGSGGPDFEELVEMIADTCIPRVRISSIEMRQVTPRLVRLIQVGKVVPHLHVPLQSGDTGVLKDMNRPYSQDDYLQLCRQLLIDIPDLAITADIMVGFPTETEERFQSSLHVAEQVGYLKVHAFTFSPRFGTVADQWGDPVPPQEKAERRLRLMAIANRTGEEFRRRFVGRVMRVLVEGKVGKDGLLEGLTDNYLTVKFAGAADMLRTIQWVRLDEERGGTLFGEVVPEGTPSNLRII